MTSPLDLVVNDHMRPLEDQANGCGDGGHQYIDRATGAVRDEPLYADGLIRWVYSRARENAPALFRMLTSARMSGVLGYLNYDLLLGRHLTGNQRFLNRMDLDLSECLEAEQLKSARQFFERKIRYWDVRPMDDDPQVVVSPADARVLVGSLNEQSLFQIKDKFFHYEELLGPQKQRWLKDFAGGDFAIFRLTPDKYHYNHAPVSGEVVDIYHLDGQHHACNPEAVVRVATPYSKNERVVTVIDTDRNGPKGEAGSGLGRVVMIEVVALMIGDIVQAYSDQAYDHPQPVRPGTFLRKGQPKSLYKPGSSTDLLLFEPGRVRFDRDLLENLDHPQAQSRFTRGFCQRLVETDVQVRESIARRVGR